MKIALITDQHFGTRNDSLQFHEYFEKFYSEKFFPVLEERGISTIIELGDIFDRRKYINFDSLDRARKYFFDPIKEKNLQLHCIVGNHDIYFKNTNRVNALNLLLGEYDFNVYEEMTEISFDGLDIMFIPWINSENYKSSMDQIASSNCRVVMGHLELAGFEMHRGAMNETGLNPGVFKRYDMVMTGHYHHKSSKNNIHYLGSPYEMNWGDYNDPRGFHIFDTDTLELEYIQNHDSMFRKVFYDDTEKCEQDILDEDYSDLRGKYVKIVVKQKNNPYIFDIMIDKINNFAPAHLQVVEDNFNLNLEDSSDIIDEAEDTVTIIKNYLGNLNLENTKEYESLFHELYHEALSVE